MAAPVYTGFGETTFSSVRNVVGGISSGKAGILQGRQGKPRMSPLVKLARTIAPCRSWPMIVGNPPGSKVQPEGLSTETPGCWVSSEIRSRSSRIAGG